MFMDTHFFRIISVAGPGGRWCGLFVPEIQGDRGRQIARCLSKNDCQGTPADRELQGGQPGGVHTAPTHLWSTPATEGQPTAANNTGAHPQFPNKCQGYERDKECDREKGLLEGLQNVLPIYHPY